MNIKDIDLNLLVLFKQLMTDRSVSVAAKKLKMSQPAISQALERLRSQLNDPLLVRQPRGMTPTPKALALIEPLTKILNDLDSLIDPGGTFELSRMTGQIRMASSDYIELLIIGALVSRIAKTAPLLDLAFLNAGGELPKVALASGEFDLAIAGYFRDLPDGYYRQQLTTDEFSGVCRRGHPAVKKGSMTLKKFVDHPHLMIAPGGVYTGAVDRALAKKNMKRRVAVGMGYFMSPAFALEQTDYLMTIPKRLAVLYQQRHKIEIFEIPLELSPIKIVQVWHERTHNDPVRKWFRAQVAEVFAGLQ